MKTIFNKLNYTISDSNLKGTALKLIVINNSDGSPRWIMPANAPQPWFLKFYNMSGLKSITFVVLCRLIFLFKLQSRFFKTQTFYLSKNIENTLIDLFKDNWAIFTGTVGPNNKALLYVKESHKANFYKIAVSDQAQQLLNAEFETTTALNDLELDKIIFPAAKMLQPDLLKLDDISVNGKRDSNFGALHIDALSELYSKTAQISIPSETPSVQQSKERLAKLLKVEYSKIPNGLLAKMQLLEQSLTDYPFVTTACHGDFTPWNMYKMDKLLAIYDWELSENNMPLGFDAFHFIIQKGILVDHKPWSKIKNELEKKLSTPFYHWDNNLKWIKYLKYYLYINTTKYLEIYNAQENWHLQINWLLQTWSDAISDILTDEFEDRRLVINDLFDYISKFKYAAIKFPDITPEELPVFSDIDLCIEKKDLNSIIYYLKKHTLTSKVVVKRKSFMTSIQLIMKDKGILSLDLIHTLKRKSMVMMNAFEVLQRAETNKFGVKQMNKIDNARFIGLFNGLNNSLVPNKYNLQIENLSTSNNKLDTLIYTNYLSGEIPQNKLNQILNTMNMNIGFSKIKNQILYIWDSIRGFFAFDGFIITFSGVDGAGKSTVIENVKLEIEKKFRKNVVIIRHRPSVLPILSAWTKGKSRAEQDAANTLPRQGSNKSTIGSIARFAYYYSDYLFGQFVIQIKYVSRGYVVLYDRYYFDFINDSERSNIRLSARFVKAGYRFLLEPHLNFFLYADAETILKRKQELDKSTIETLTEKYLSLFKKLNKHGVQRYFPIENVDLATTINYIMNKSQKEIC